MTIDNGRVPNGTGLSQAEPEDGLGPTGFDPSRKCHHCGGTGKVHGEFFTYGCGDCGSTGLLAVTELDDAYAVVAEMLAYFDNYNLATWAPLAAIILRERNRRDSDGSPKGGDAAGGSVRSTTARPEGIAQ